MTTKPTMTTFAAVLLITTLWSGFALAGTGLAVSGSASIDTRFPVVTVNDPPANTILHAGETIDLSWALFDDNPHTGPDATVAEMWLGDLHYETRSFSSATGQYLWTWPIPDASSGSVHLVVRSADAFGNLTVDQSANFTILSSITDVPTAENLPVFALPAPNPFNPLTMLQFNLPESGPVRVTVHDARGFQIDTLLQSHQPAGRLSLRWSGADAAGRRQAGGTYFFRLEYQHDGRTQRLVHKAVLLP